MSFYEHSPKPLRFLYTPITLASNKLGLERVYNVTHSGFDNYQGLEDKPVMILAKHQHYFDIPLEAESLRRGAGRKAHFVMKYSLPVWMEELAGVKIFRPKDLKAIEDKQRRREVSKRGKVNNKRTDAYLTGALKESEVILIHPETTRNPYIEGFIPPQMLTYVMELQENSGKEVAFVPLDIHYDNPMATGSDIEVAVREPVFTEDPSELEKHLVREIELLRFRR